MSARYNDKLTILELELEKLTHYYCILQSDNNILTGNTVLIANSKHSAGNMVY